MSLGKSILTEKENSNNLPQKTYLRLKAKIALVTASASGIGQGKHIEKTLQEIELDIPLGKFGESFYVTFGELSLASDESKYITGIELSIYEGILASGEAKTE